MTLLEQIASETRSGFGQPDNQIATQATANHLYRGLAHDVQGTSGESLLKKAKLDWRVCELPVMIQGKHEVRQFPGRKALVRCDNGAPIEIVSDRFKVHQNAELLGSLEQLTQAANIKLTHAGEFDGGAKVFLHGSIDRQFELPTGKPSGHAYHGDTYGSGSDTMNHNGQRKGDAVRLDFSATGGHRPGEPSTIAAVLMRLVCLNGAVAADANGKVVFRVTHRAKFSAMHIEAMQKFVDRAIDALGIYETKAARLAATPMNHSTARAYLIELVQPELLQAVALGRDLVENEIHRYAGKHLLDEILNRDTVMARIERGAMPSGTRLDRAARGLIENLDKQPGHDLSAGTAWDAYNAVTHYVDHVRGRGDSSAVESAISGEGAKLKERALELALDYAQRLN